MTETGQTSARERKKAWLGPFLLIFWFSSVSVPLAMLMAPHMFPFRREASTAPAQADGRWRVTHVLAAECGCSRTVADTLIRRGPDRDATTHVVIIGQSATLGRDLEAAGFPVEFATAEQARARYGVRGGPWLIVNRPDGIEAYSGGYGPRRPVAAADVHDVEIVSAVRSGRQMNPYPAFGCILSNGGSSS